MYCSHCGAQIAEDSRYCSSCGYKLMVYSGQHVEKRIPVPVERSRTEMLDDADRFYRTEASAAEKRVLEKNVRQQKKQASAVPPVKKSIDEDIPWRHDPEEKKGHSTLYRVMAVLTGVLLFAASCMTIIAWRIV